jgi:hypothetical protein
MRQQTGPRSADAAASPGAFVSTNEILVALPALLLGVAVLFQWDTLRRGTTGALLALSVLSMFMLALHRGTPALSPAAQASGGTAPRSFASTTTARLPHIAAGPVNAEENAP